MKTSEPQELTFEGQSIHLDGVINARQLGGIIMPDGRQVKNGCLVRCGALNKASAEDLRRLHDEFHIVLDFDLRSEYEMKSKPDLEVEGMRHVPLPVLDESGLKEEEVKTFTLLEKDPDGLVRMCATPFPQNFARNMYTSFVTNEYTQLQYSAFFNMILAQEEGGILWHCSQGKDRTGMAAAYLLAALGADRAAIMADYRLSAHAYAPLFEKLSAIARKQNADTLTVETIRSFASINPVYFEAALDVIDRDFGGMHNYLNEILLVSDDDIKELQHRYLGQVPVP